MLICSSEDAKEHLHAVTFERLEVSRPHERGMRLLRSILRHGGELGCCLSSSFVIDSLGSVQPYELGCLLRFGEGTHSFFWVGRRVELW